MINVAPNVAPEWPSLPRPFALSTSVRSAGTITSMTIIRDTLDAWHLAARWPAYRRRRYRLGLLLYVLGLRRVAVRVAAC